MRVAKSALKNEHSREQKEIVDEIRRLHSPPSKNRGSRFVDEMLALLCLAFQGFANRKEENGTLVFCVR